MNPQKFSRWIGAGMAALMVALTPVSAFADDGGGHFHGNRHRNALSGVCAKVESAVQTAPGLAYYSGVRTLLNRCGMPVQPAGSRPGCTNLLQAVDQAGMLHRYSGVMRELRNCLLPQQGTGFNLGSNTVPNPGLNTGLNTGLYPGLNTGAPLQLSSPFNDLRGWGWALKDIEILSKMGIVGGVTPHRYDPAGKLTRAQFAALMKRVFNLSVPTTPTAYVDVQPGTWFYNDVEAAASYMSSFDTPGGVAFEPGIDVTRIEVAATIGKVLVQENQAQLPSQSQAQAAFAQFTDAAQVPPGLEQYAAVAVTMGYMKGLPNGSFGVESPLDRAQAAVLLVRVLRSSETMSGIAPGTSTTYSVNGTLSSVSGQQVVVDTTSGQVTLTLASSYAVTLNGSASSVGALANGDAVTLTVDTATGQVTAVAATTSTSTTYTLSGTLTSTTGDLIMISTSAGPLTLYLAPSYTVTLGGSASSLGALVDGDAVTLTVETATSQVTTIAATSTTSGTSSVSGAFDSENGSQIVVTPTGGSPTSYTVVSGYTVTLDGSASSLGALVAGDAVTLTVESGTDLVSAISATSTTTATSSVSGTFDSESGSQIVVTPTGGSPTSYTVVSGYTVTLNGSASALGALVAGDAVTLTVESGTDLVSAISATSVAVQTVTGYIVAEPSTVSLSVYATTGAIQTFQLATGATVTLNSQTESGLSAVPRGDLANVSVNAQGQATEVAATTPNPAPVTGAYEGLSNGNISVFTGTVQSIPAGASPVVYDNGAATGLTSTSIAAGTEVTVDPTGAGGSALVIVE